MWTSVYRKYPINSSNQLLTELDFPVCFYCGFSQREDCISKHDYSCPYLWNASKLEHRGSGEDVEVWLNDGVMPPSDSFF